MLELRESDNCIFYAPLEYAFLKLSAPIFGHPIHMQVSYITLTQQLAIQHTPAKMKEQEYVFTYLSDTATLHIFNYLVEFRLFSLEKLKSSISVERLLSTWIVGWLG